MAAQASTEKPRSSFQLLPTLLSIVILVGLGPSLWSCGSDSSGPEVDNTVASVTVTPSSPSLTSIGATTQLSASARNAAGAAVSGVTFTWASSNTSVATVSSSGLVTAVANGMATMTATASGSSRTGTATVTVAQTAATVTVSPQDGIIAVGQTLQLSATAEDAGGTAIPSPTLTWSSSDETVATVSSTGLVTGVEDGAVTITAASGSANGTAPVTINRANVTIDADTDLSGEVRADDFTVAEGVTVTATDSLVIDATGLIQIAGTVEGDCVPLAIQGDTAVTITGTIDNGCAQGEEGKDLYLAANGELTLEDAVVMSSGDILVTNDPSLTDDDFPEAGAVLVPRHANRAGPGEYTTTLTRSKVRHKGGEAGPDPAPDGVEGVVASNGWDGKGVKLRLRGNVLIGQNVQFWSQDGGKGGDGMASSASGDLEAAGGDGGKGGDVSLFTTGSIEIFESGNKIQSGSGGQGGEATATALPDDDGDKAPGATARGGAGGNPGVINVRVGGTIEIASAQDLTVIVGYGGEGGTALAIGADGRDALSASINAQAGGDAFAYGGKGGSIPAGEVIKGSYFSSQKPTVRGPEAQNLQAGDGGKATAQGGQGGDGIQPNKPGAAGGDLWAQGGKGGDMLLTLPGGDFAGVPGGGGTVHFQGGNGGRGWSDCAEGATPESGGPGGGGGGTAGFPGDGGLDSQGIGGKLQRGLQEFQNVGNGGRGGDGENPGAGGPKGTQHQYEATNTFDPPTFQDGATGDHCTVPEPPLVTYVELESLPNTGGQVDPGTYTVELVDEYGNQMGEMPVTAWGAPDSHAMEELPLRWQWGPGDSGYDFDLAAATVLGLAFEEVQQVQVCFPTTVVTEDNPLVIEHKSDDGDVLMREALGFLDPNPGSAQNCKMIFPAEGTSVIRIHGGENGGSLSGGPDSQGPMVGGTLTGSGVRR